MMSMEVAHIGPGAEEAANQGAVAAARCVEFDLRIVEPATPDAPLLMLLPPPRATLRPAPVALCVHGYTRQPLDQLRAFAPLAAAQGMALVLPLFDERRHRRYQQLLHPKRGTRSDLALLAALDRLAGRHRLDVQRLFLFGYSGGAQFVHRFAMLHPERSAALAIGAAGWYTWPDTAHPWPLGLGDVAELLGAAVDLAAFLRLPKALWVGERDNAPDEYLREGAEIVGLQGQGRLERARRWADAVVAAARAQGIEQPAPLVTLPRSGHDFGVCDRRGGLASQVMEFFARHR
jgi:pimeloyl-ACP methyl ester carboxylesterase